MNARTVAGLATIFTACAVVLAWSVSILLTNV